MKKFLLFFISICTNIKIICIFAMSIMTQNFKMYDYENKNQKN